MSRPRNAVIATVTLTGKGTRSRVAETEQVIRGHGLLGPLRCLLLLRAVLTLGGLHFGNGLAQEQVPNQSFPVFATRSQNVSVVLVPGNVQHRAGVPLQLFEWSSGAFAEVPNLQERLAVVCNGGDNLKSFVGIPGNVRVTQPERLLQRAECLVVLQVPDDARAVVRRTCQDVGDLWVPGEGVDRRVVPLSSALHRRGENRVRGRRVG
mmetsp:Transcript_38526/g.56717  ORF Transcript_38526/g.56717 Transcript_38526/m.56717 type:complete len:208 (-) Transcript_38526:575-1198(-)